MSASKTPRAARCVDVCLAYYCAGPQRKGARRAGPFSIAPAGTRLLRALAGTLVPAGVAKCRERVAVAAAGQPVPAGVARDELARGAAVALDVEAALPDRVAADHELDIGEVVLHLDVPSLHE